MQIIKSIQNRIYEIRGERVMLDFDLASLYEVETRVLNQAVKRNIKRFPEDFMFQLTSAEFEEIRFQREAINEGASSQIVIKDQPNLKSQFVTSSWGGTRKLPYAFTEQGVAMLSGVVNSDKAINMNIAIMRAFVDVRKILLKQSNINEQLTEIKERIGEHDVQLNELYDAMENLIDEKIAQLKWNDRQRIGFKIKE
ncbi:ORF6N domain-containing protein [Pedobacter sp. MR2016-19]|uniref:ORF6N domain-containing protein n=1 Tax=Pedobacter sp. MR2016-19 TaxID=2780089 RepID=UPI001875A526|nr:ORF6N domain-containing protein [Pedobacter sp. MR2016-19]MBE5319139.1 ORF6N domain-containing protein [Pedobacter sp. MR2016-19]